MPLPTRPIFYDLSEIFLSAGARVKIYGVIRVIAEIGLELQHSGRPVRFVVFSPAHRAFFDVDPCFARLHDGDSVDLSIPPIAVPKQLRSVFHHRRWLRRLSYLVTAPLVQAANRRCWQLAGMTLREADMGGGLLLSAARPKFIVEYLSTLQRSATQLVAMLHDLIPLHDDPWCKRQSNFRGDNCAILRQAAGIIANSNFTRAEIARFANRGIIPAPARIGTVQLAQECRDSPAPVRRAPPQGAYFLCVGSAVGRKNLETVFDALNLIRHGPPVPPFTLLVAGHISRSTREWLARPGYDGIRLQVQWFDSPSHAELLQLYRRATAVVVPTRIEGWGLPAGEALWLGTPAICADIPALHEATDGLALYVDPDAPSMLATLLVRLLTDTAFRDAQTDKIRAAHGRLRSWAQVAADLYDEALSYANTRPAELMHA
jgi:glycosyltransferase involved in cell wall biosynthesis